MSKRSLAIMLVLSSLFATGTAGAVCAMPPPKLCNAYFRADVVLRGKVLSEQRGSEWTRYHIKVDRSFKGKALSIRTLYTDNNDFGRLSLDVGNEYVLFASRQNDRLVIGCDQQPLSEANIAVMSAGIEWLRASKSTVATIEGRIVSASDSLPLPGVSVTATGTGGVYRMVSDKEGLFSVHVPPGRYRVDVDPTVAKQTIYKIGYSNPNSVNLAPGQCAQLQYHGVRR